jgi:predicted ester cyclase
MLPTLQRYIPVDFQSKKNDPELNKYIVRNYYAAIDRYGKASLVYFLREDFSASMTGFEERLDGQSFGAVLSMLYGAIRGFHHELIEVTAQGDQVNVRMQASGVHTGELFGVPATGNAIAVPGQVVFTLQDNRIIAAEIEFDLPLLMQQLGVLKVTEAQYA